MRASRFRRLPPLALATLATATAVEAAPFSEPASIVMFVTGLPGPPPGAALSPFPIAT